jgi:hypothetical protein
MSPMSAPAAKAFVITGKHDAADIVVGRDYAKAFGTFL